MSFNRRGIKIFCFSNLFFVIISVNDYGISVNGIGVRDYGISVNDNVYPKFVTSCLCVLLLDICR